MQTNLSSIFFHDWVFTRVSLRRKNPHKIQTAEGEELSNETTGPSYYILKDAAFQLMIWYSGEAAVFLGGVDAPLKFSKIIITKFSPCISSTTKAYAPSKIHVRFLLTHQIICPSNYACMNPQGTARLFQIICQGSYRLMLYYRWWSAGSDTMLTSRVLHLCPLFFFFFTFFALNHSWKLVANIWRIHPIPWDSSIVLLISLNIYSHRVTYKFEIVADI